SPYAALSRFFLPSFPTRRSSDLVERGTRDGAVGIVLAKRDCAACGSRRCRICQKDCCLPDVCSEDAIRDMRIVESPLCRTHKRRDRKSTRLNSSHRTISYAVFCL